MTEIIFTVHGSPVPKGRARSVIRGGKIGHYTPDKTKVYENKIRETATRAMIVAGVKAFTGPVDVSVTVKLPIPGSWSKSKKALALSGDICPTSKPDLDNVLKAVSDGMNGVVFVDDSQIVTITASKRYSTEPRVEITVDEVKNASR